MAKDRHILHAAARRRGNSLRAAILIAALAVLAGATAAVQPAQAQTTVNICERTPEVRDAILLLIAGAECTAVSQTSLDGITELDLQGRRSEGVIIPTVSALQAGDFANLSNLESLNLNFNSLETPTSLPANVFDGLSNLQELLLGVNSMTSVSATVFGGLSSLMRLNLGTNNLESLPTGLFDGLSALDDLTLDRNNLQSLDENVFGGLSNLRHLNLSRNHNLESLPAGLFDGLSTLQELILYPNDSLTSLPVGLFNDVLDTLTLLEINTAFRTTVSMEPNTATIALNGIQTFTAQLTLPSPAAVRLTITAGGDEEGNIILPDPATVTIPAGMTSADFDITLPEATVGNTGRIELSDAVLIYTDTNGDEQESTNVVRALVNVPGTIASTFAVTVAEVPPTMLTRNNPSTEEGASPTPGIFTLALSNAPDGLSTVTYTLAVSGDNANPADISAELGGGASGILETSGASDIFTMTATDGDASATLTITPIDDDDATDEVVTLTIIGIEFARISIGPDDIQGTDVSNGALAITITDDDPAAIYDLEDSTASEPTSSTATDATTATFTITLNNLNGQQMGSPNRRFFFNLKSGGEENGDLRTPGHGIDSDDLASTTDFTLSLEYQSETGPSEVEFTFHDTGTAGGTFSSVDVIPKAVGGTEEVYRFHIIPTHDDDEEGAERVLFGYRVHFSGDDSLRLTGVVDGSAAAPAATIRDDAALRLRIRTFLEGALQ